MAKVAERSGSTKGRPPEWILLGIIGLIAVAAGVAVPFFWFLKQPSTVEQSKGVRALVEFDEVVVNINDGAQGRFLRMKLKLVMDGQQKQMEALVDPKKPYMKDWLIRYLRLRTYKDLQTPGSDNRVRREIKEKFNEMVFPDHSDKISDILFVEFQFQ